MVEFVRDVMIAVALLAMVIAFAVHPVPESEPLRQGGTAPVISIGAPPGLATATAVQGAATPK